MGVSKTKPYSFKQNCLAIYAKALGHPARIAIIDHILNNPQCPGKYLQINIPLSQPTISQHLNQLVNSGLVKRSIQKNNYIYSLSEIGFRTLQYYCDRVSRLNL